MRASPLKHANQLMTTAVERGVFPAAVLLVAKDYQLVWHRAYGQAALDTVFDLASLTKAIATTSVFIELVSRGHVKLDQRLQGLLPLPRSSRLGNTALWQLLNHSSGLPAWAPLHRAALALAPARRRLNIRRAVAKSELVNVAPTRVAYSDLGFILLDWIAERQTGLPLDRLTQRLLSRPLNLSRTAFVRVDEDGPREPERFCGWTFAPTERCPWRRRRLRGEVHDDNCHAMGGVSGHAGLFGTALDVHAITAQLVAAYDGRASLFEPKTVRRFFDSRRGPAPQRALGWDRPSGTSPSAGRLFGPTAIGHLGFTGTSLWIDLSRRLWVVLLSNRVYGGRDNIGIRKLRPRLHDAILGAL